jgi:hypothetical protein
MVLRLRKGDLRTVTVIAIITFGATFATTDAAFAWTSTAPTGPSAGAGAPYGRRGHSPGGNLVVSVPRVPDLHHLRRICTDLLSPRHDSGGRSKEDSTDLQALIAVTGGTRASAIAWCENYLHPKRGHHRH